MKLYTLKKIMQFNGKRTLNYTATALFLLLLSSLTSVNAYQVGETFQDCSTCPEMVVLPAGEFIMGSPKEEIGRRDDEGPQRWVTIPNPFAVGKYEVTVGQFEEFAKETDRKIEHCNLIEGTFWSNPGFKQTNNHPVVCVNWHDASAYVDWLSKKTGHEYRLLSEAEWEYAARAGTTAAYYFGKMNYNYAQYFSRGTLAVGSFPANAFGLHDMHGNVWEWVQDCWHLNYKEAPTDGSAWSCGVLTKEARVLRGGSWNDLVDSLRSANRFWNYATYRPNYYGFRVARTFTSSDSSFFSKTIDGRRDLLTTSDTPQGKTSPSSVILVAYKYAKGIRNDNLIIGNNALMVVKAILEKARDILDNQVPEEIDGAIQELHGNNDDLMRVKAIAEVTRDFLDNQVREEIDGAIRELQRIINWRDLKTSVNTPDTVNLIEDIPELTYPYEAGKIFRDCATCPAMVVLPAGEFTMGSPEEETGRNDDEGPRHQVTIPNPFAVGKYEVTIAQFIEFVKETKHKIGDCDSIIPGQTFWYNPGFKQTDDHHPVVCVNWYDASAYADWLSTKTSHEYRLLTEAEWEYAARARTTTAYYFGKLILENHVQYDGNETTAVGSFPANAFGLHDMHGSVWEWVQDCGHLDYKKAPTDGSAWLSYCVKDEHYRMLRGGSWLDVPENLRSASRAMDVATLRGNTVGFRVARTLNP